MSDATPFGFGKFVPGFDFLQSLTKGASGGIPQMPQMANWVAPTVSVEELEKRIEELKAVQFWLDQNSRALTATVQALEVQKMTLATLKGMNVHMADVANAFKSQAAGGMMAGVPKADAGFAWPSGAASSAAPTPARETSAPAPAPAPAPTPASAAPAASGGGTAPGGNDTTKSEPEGGSSASPGIVDPMQWWGALTQQFQQIAAAALKDTGQPAALDSTGKLAARMAQDAVKRANDMAAKMAAQGAKAMQAGTRSAAGNKPVASGTGAAPRKAAAKKTTARSKSAATKTAAPRKSPTAARRNPKA